MKKLIIAIIFSIASSQLMSQNVEDIVRISKTGTIGSARVLGAGGAWGAIGADLSSASINPAGLGFYRRNEVMGSVAITANFADATFLGNLRKDGRTNFNIPNIGAAFTYVNQEKGNDANKGFVSVSFAIGMNRTADFQQNSFYSGISKNNALGEYLALKSNGINKNDLGNIEGLAFNNRLIDTTFGRNDSFNSWFGRYGDKNYSVIQSQSTQLRGSLNEWYFGVGTNISNFIYIGASAVLNSTNITQTTTFNEDINSKSVASNPYSGNTYSTYTATSGSGVGGKFGIIISPIDYFRVGLSYQTPIRVNLTDDYNYSLTTNIASNSNNSSSGNLSSEYQIITPGKITLSGAFMLPKYGFISADYEIIDYRDGQIKSKDFQSYFEKFNTLARTNLAGVNNLRIGGEYRWDNYRFRAGYNLINSAYSTEYKSTKQESISGGLGMLWGDGYFIDAAVVRSWGNTYNTPYATQQSATIEVTNYNFIISGGLRF